jgi:cytochrome c
VRSALVALALASACARAGEPAPPSPEILAAGERAFQKCYACHAVDPAETGAEGPALTGIVGRKVASLPGYAYSPAMRAYGADGKAWTRERLDAFLADPPRIVPHTAMNFFGLKDPQERAALIAWLAEQR